MVLDWNSVKKRDDLETSEPVPANWFRRAVFGIRRPTRSREGTLRGAFAAFAPMSGSGPSGNPTLDHSGLRLNVDANLVRRRLALANARSMANNSLAVSSSSATSAASAWAVTRRVSSSRAVASDESSAGRAGIG